MSAPELTRRSQLRSVARRHPLWLIAVGVTLYGTGPVLVASAEVSGPVFSFWRLWFGVATLGLAMLLAIRLGGTRWPRFTDRGEGRRTRQQGGWTSWRWAVWGGLAFGAHQLCFFTAVMTTSVTDVQLMSTIAPLITAFAAVPLFGERMTGAFRLWTLLAIAGAAIVAVGGALGPEGNPVGMTLATINVFLFSAFYLISKRGREDIDVLPFLFGVMFFAALAVTGWCLATGEPVLSSTSSLDLGKAAVLAVGPGAVGHFVMTWPLKWVPANVPPVMRLTQPLIGGFLAWLWLAQPVTTEHVVGGVLTLFGVFGALASRTPRPADTEPQPPG